MATYYVNTDIGNDDNVGTEIEPWKTVSKVNGSTFLPGDSVLFKRGQTFRGRLVCPSSGSESEPIVFGGYGEGDATLINAATLIDNADFSHYVGDVSGDLWTYTSDSTNADDGATRNYRVIFPSSVLSGAGNSVRVTLSAGVSNWPILGVGIGKQTIGQNVESITRVTFDSGSSTVTIPGGGSTVSDYVEFEVEAGAAYVVTIYTESRHLTLRNAPGVTLYYATTAGDTSQTTSQEYALNTPESTPGISKIEVLIDAADVKIYEADLAANPRIVWEDYARLTVKSSLGACNAALASFYYDSVAAKVYIRPTGDVSPITNGRQYDAGNTTNTEAISDNGKNYNSIALDCCNTVGDNTVFGGVLISGDGSTYAGRSFNAERHLISFKNGSAMSTAQNFEAFNSDDSAIVSFSPSSPGCQNNIVRGGSVYQTPGYTGSLIGCHGGEYSSINWTIEDVDCGAVYGTGDYQGWVFVYGGSGDVKFKRCTFRGPAYKTIDIEDAHEVEFLSCVFFVDGAADVNALIKLEASSGCKLIHNTFVGSNTNEIMQIIDMSSDNTIKNNIFMVEGKIINAEATALETTSIDWNCYPADTTDKFKLDADDELDFAAWQTATSLDANSRAEEPEVLSDGRLSQTSPCIDVGAWITGVNDTGEVDIWGNYIHRLPNIGADQGAGGPGSISIVFNMTS